MRRLAYSIIFGVDLGAIWDGIWSAATRSVTGFLRFFKNDVPRFLKGSVNAIIDSIEAIPNSFIDGLNAIVRAWNNFSFGTPAVKVLGKTVVPGFQFNTPDIGYFGKVSLPRLAEGGIVRATPGGRAVRVGEGGEDEVIAPLSKLGNVGGQQFVFNFHGDVYGIDDLEDRVSEWVNVGMARGSI